MLLYTDLVRLPIVFHIPLVTHRDKQVMSGHGADRRRGMHVERRIGSAAVMNMVRNKEQLMNNDKAGLV